MKLEYFRYTDASYQTYSQQCRQATNEAPFVTTPSPITEELARRGKYCSAGNSSFLPLRETVNICASQFSLSLSLCFVPRIFFAASISPNYYRETKEMRILHDNGDTLFSFYRQKRPSLRRSSSPFERHSTT